MMKPQAATILAGSLYADFKNFSAVNWCSNTNGPISCQQFHIHAYRKSVLKMIHVCIILILQGARVQFSVISSIILCECHRIGIQTL